MDKGQPRKSPSEKEKKKSDQKKKDEEKATFTLFKKSLTDSENKQM